MENTREIVLDIKNGKLENASFVGGCNGNLKGICELCRGMDIKDIIARVEGIECGHKGTSCPDQLAAALKSYIAQKGDDNA